MRLMWLFSTWSLASLFTKSHLVGWSKKHGIKEKVEKVSTQG